ncbi:MAG: hypothetical protein A2582_01445 [Candidatus Pacebacteria bacterium RIFOXYD1_FULL_39_27]|nr:MAG: hypothetical protein A2582_01445 [Candidatus Pacebacteria bacterium RIFOXYD1_FULL_39_27]
MNEALQNSWNYLAVTTLNSLALLLPKVLGAFTALVVGVLLAKAVRSLVQKVLQAVGFSKMIDKTPLQLAFQDEKIGQKIQASIANLFYWVSVVVVIYIMVAILGLSSVTVVLENILGYIPSVISAIFILLFGVLVAGWVESLVKNSVRAIDQKTSRVMGKISGYFVVTLAAMSAFSELGIAEQFLTVMFIGLVATLTLGFGLALGLGGKKLVEKVLEDWYEDFSNKNKKKK